MIKHDALYSLLKIVLEIIYQIHLLIAEENKSNPNWSKYTGESTNKTKIYVEIGNPCPPCNLDMEKAG